MTRLLIVKLLRDLRANWSRLGLMVVAISVSLSVFGAVLYAWSVMGRETADAYAGTEPASATIVLDRGLDTETMEALAAEVNARPQVIAASGRSQFIGGVTVDGRLLDIPLQVFLAAPDDPMRIARFDVDGASWPPSPSEIFIARDSLELLGVAVGDGIAVTLPDGELRELRVTGTVYDPSLSPSPQEQTGRAYLSTASLVDSADDSVLEQLKLQVSDSGSSTPTRDRQTAVAVASEVGEWMREEHGLALREIQVPEPYAHPHQWQADSLVGALLAGGIAAVLLSAILVANMLNGLFTQQVPQIGILKAIGARSRQIGLLYLAMTVVVAAAATLLALLPAILGGRAFVAQVLGFLGIDATTLDAPWWTYAIILVVGLGLPPVMASVPLLRASRTTVRAAIDHHAGTTEPSAGSRFLAGLRSPRGLDRGVLMALRNTVRRPARFFLAVGLLASAGTVFVAGMSLSAGVAAVEEEQTAQRSWDVDVQLARPTSLADMRPVLERLSAVTRVEGLSVVPIGVAGRGKLPVTRTYPDQGHGRVSLVAVPRDATLFTAPTLVDGRWLESGEPGAVVLNQVARNNTVPDAAVGDTVQLLVGGTGTTWTIVGIVQEKAGGALVYATAEGFAATGQPPTVNQLRVATAGHDETTRTEVAETAEVALTDAGFDVVAADSVSRREAVSEGHLGPLITIVLAIAIAMGLIGGIGLASTMSANVLDRTREFGVLHAIGARPSVVRGIVTLEGVIVAVASVVIAIIPALALTALLGIGLGNLFLSAPLPYRVSLLAVAIWIALVVLGAVLATEAAATRASRLTIREALTYL